MYPILFEIPGLGFPVRSFGVLVALGFLVGLNVWSRLLARYGDDPENDPERGAAAAMWVLVGVLAGGRLMYVVVESFKYWSLENPTGNEIGAQFVNDPLSILFVWQGGLVMYGGFFGAMLLGARAAKKSGLVMLNALDTGMTAAFVGQAIGRVGCLLVGDDYGSLVPEKYAGLPFPIVLNIPETLREGSLFEPALRGEAVWATQAWMALNALMIAAVAMWLLKRRRYYGQIAQWLLVHYAVTRFAIESFRGDSVRGLWLDGALSTSQLISIPCALLGVALLWKNRKRRELITPPPGGQPA